MIRNRFSLYVLAVCFILIIALCLVRISHTRYSDKLTNNITDTDAHQTLEMVINLDSRTLEIVENGEVIKTYLVAVGNPSTPTPTGEYEVINKMKYPGGAYGTRWIGLSAPHIGIHGTNAPETIGQAESGGCIRMMNEDIETLFARIKIGTKVIIIQGSSYES